MASFLARAINWGESLPAISSLGLFALNAESGVVTELIADRYPSLRVSPDSSRVVYGGDEGIFLADSDGTNQVKLAGTRPPYRVYWYPDSSGLIYTNAEGTFEVDATSRRQIKIMDPIETGDQRLPFILLSSSSSSSSTSSRILYSTNNGLFSLSADRTERNTCHRPDGFATSLRVRESAGRRDACGRVQTGGIRACRDRWGQ